MCIAYNVLYRMSEKISKLVGGFQNTAKEDNILQPTLYSQAFVRTKVFLSVPFSSAFVQELAAFHVNPVPYLSIQMFSNA